MAIPAQLIYMQSPDTDSSARSGLGVLSDADCDSLNRFLKSVEKRAYHMALMGTSHREDALDVVQDAMLRFARAYARKPAAQWPPLFYKVLNSRLTDWYRRRAVRRRWGGWLSPVGPDGKGDAMANVPDPVAMDPERELQSNELGSALRSALNRLPIRQRQAFLLRTWEGFSVAETATAMGCGQGSVKTHLSRAMASMRIALGSDYHD